MNRLKAFAAASCMSVAMFAVSQPAMADQWNKRTILTINEAVQVPGAVLQPGKYVMKLMDSPSNRHIVQIFNEREDHLYTTVLAIPNYRLQPTGRTEFGWWEVPAGQPRAMRAWFYPGDNFGQEFAYPKTAAVQIASVNNASVPVVEAENATDLATAKVSAVDKAGTEMELDRQTYKAATPAAAPATENTTVAQNQATQQDVAAPAATPAATPMPAATPAPARRTLPSTASPFPLYGLGGFLALGASTIARKLAKRS